MIVMLIFVCTFSIQFLTFTANFFHHAGVEKKRFSKTHVLYSFKFVSIFFMYQNHRRRNIRVKRWRNLPFVIPVEGVRSPSNDDRLNRTELDWSRKMNDSEYYLWEAMARKHPQPMYRNFYSDDNFRTMENKNLNNVGLSNCFGNFRQFCLESSLHGLHFIVQREKSIYERILWFLTLCVVYVGCGYLIKNSVQLWLSSPVIMSMESKPTSVAFIPFPAVTVCGTNQIKASVFNFTTFATTRDQFKHEINRTFLNQLDYANIMCQNLFDEQFNTVNLDLKVFQAMLNSAHETCREIYAAIKWTNETFINPCKFMQPVLTELGMCYSFNMIPLKVLLRDFYYEMISLYHFQQEQKSNWSSLSFSDWQPMTGYDKKPIRPEDVPRRTSGSGNLYSFTASVKINSAYYDPHCHGGSQGYTILIHSPADMPLSTNAKMVVTEGSLNRITVRPEIIRTSRELESWTPSERGCYLDEERNLYYYKLYTQTNCNLECESNYSLYHCGCVAFYHPLQLAERITKDKPACDCLPACTTLHYESNVRSAAFLSKPHEPNPMEIQQPADRRNIVELNETEEYEKSLGVVCTFSVSYENRETLGIIRRALFPFSGFLGNIGGILGLFLGFSWISLVEIAYFIVLRPMLRNRNEMKDTVSSN